VRAAIVAEHGTERKIMAAAKIKIFRSGDPTQLETEVNLWLASLPSTAEVHRTETALATIPSNGGEQSVIVITAWYFLPSGSN
jgi:hypothetical protein